MRRLPPELTQGQAAGRPDWQKGLPMDTLIMIDRKANAAFYSEAALDAYLEFTRQWRPGIETTDAESEGDSNAPWGISVKP